MKMKRLLPFIKSLLNFIDFELAIEQQATLQLIIKSKP